MRDKTAKCILRAFGQNRSTITPYSSLRNYDLSDNQLRYWIKQGWIELRGSFHVLTMQGYNEL
jgi:hypothetical protein